MEIESSTGSESIPIESLKESDKVLVADASGTRFEPVIVVDLHEVDIDQNIVRVTTTNG